jgi:Mce-associated membrane protein
LPGEAGSVARAREWLAAHIGAVVIGLIVVTLAGALIVTTLQLRHRNAIDSARTSALAAAKADAVALASYNYRDLNQDFAKVLAVSTPSFRQSFNSSSQSLKSVLTKYDATASASVSAAGVVSASTSRAVVLLFLDQTVTNTTQKKTTTQSRVEITLLHSGGRWLINDVSLL